MGIWQVTALGDRALEPYGQIAGPCPARFTSLAIQVRDASTKMDRDLAGAAGAGNPFRTPGHDPSGQIRVPATAGRSRDQSVRDTPGRNPRQPLQVPVWVVVA